MQELSKILQANQIQQHFEKFLYHEQVGFTHRMQGWFNIHKSITLRANDKNDKMFTWYRKGIWPNTTSFHDNNSQQMRCWREVPQHNTGQTWQAYSIVNDEMQNTGPLRSGTGQWSLLSPSLCTTVLNVLARKGNGKFSGRKGGSKTVSVQTTWSYRENPKGSINTPLAVLIFIILSMHPQM